MVFETLKCPLTLIHPRNTALFLFRALRGSAIVEKLETGSFAPGSHGEFPSLPELYDLHPY